MISPERDSQAPSKLAMKQVASDWQDIELKYGKPGEYIAYEEAGEAFLERVKQADAVANMDTDAPSQVIESGAAYGGVGVVGRFFYAGAVHAQMQGLSQPELKKALYQPDSFRSLQQLTREWNGSAIAIEYAIGLNGVPYLNNEAIKNNFTLDAEKGFTINQYPILSYRARAALVENGDVPHEEAFPKTATENTIRCLGHSAGVLAYVYKYMLEVADTDSSLFKSTLS